MVLTLTVVGGVLPLLVARHYGALGIARNDDWSYLLAAFRFGESGRIDANREVQTATNATAIAVFAVNSASFDGTRWRVADTAAAAVGGPRLVNGGFEWTNYRAGRQVFLHATDRSAAAFCVVLDAEARAPRTGEADVLRASPVWGPTGT